MEVVLTQCKEEICIVAVVKGQKELAGDRKLMENFKDFCTIYHLGERENYIKFNSLPMRIFITDLTLLQGLWNKWLTCKKLSTSNWNSLPKHISFGNMTVFSSLKFCSNKCSVA